MASSSRDRISVDMRGLKAALCERAGAAGVTPSGFVRNLLVASLGDERGARLASQPFSPDGLVRMRLSLRVTQAQGVAIVDAARAAGLPLGAFVFGLVAGIPSLADGALRRDLIAAVTATNAELALLSRNLHHLGTLLRQSLWRAADEYRPVLNALQRDVRSHLEIAASALGELRPLRGLPLTGAASDGRAL